MFRLVDDMVVRPMKNSVIVEKNRGDFNIWGYEIVLVFIIIDFVMVP